MINRQENLLTLSGRFFMVTVGIRMRTDCKALRNCRLLPEPRRPKASRFLIPKSKAGKTAAA